MDAREFERMAELLPEPILLVNRAGLIRSVNPPMAKLCGQPRHTLMGLSIGDLVSDPPEKIERFLKLSAGSRQMVPATLHWRIGMDEPLAMRCEGAVLSLPTEDVPALLLVRCRPKEEAVEQFRLLGQQITRLQQEIMARKQVVEALHQSEARFRQLADSMPQIVWSAGADGVPDYFNKRWHEFTGAPPGSAGDDSWILVVHPDDVNRSRQRWADAVRTGEPYETECRMNDQARGEYRWFLVRALPVRNEQGEILRWFGTCTNIDEQKRTGEALREMNYRKDEFLAMLAHELRNPLAPIRYAIHVLKQIGPAEDVLKKQRDVIDRQVSHMARLLDDLLDISRITRGKIEIKEDRLDLRVILDHALEVARPLIDERGHRIHWHMPDWEATVQGDCIRLEQVFTNLINNAAKFTEPGGGDLGIRRTGGGR